MYEHWTLRCVNEADVQAVVRKQGFDFHFDMNVEKYAESFNLMTYTHIMH
jgi:hypothetical protein